MLTMKMHVKTGQKCLIDTLAEREACVYCVAYGPVCQLSRDLTNSTITTWEKEGVVYPLQASKGVFSTGGMDNIDYNPTSTTTSAQSVLHGTWISLIQHHESNQLPVPIERSVLDTSMTEKNNVPPLPVSFTTMDDVTLPKGERICSCHPSVTAYIPCGGSLNAIIEPAFEWLDHLHNFLRKDLNKEDNISWAAYTMLLTGNHHPAYPSHTCCLFSLNQPIT